MAFTPPTHGVAALHEALAQFTEEGGQPARLARYRDNCAVLVQGLSALRLRPLLPPSLQAPVIVTFHAPAHPAWRFQALYEATRR